MPNDGRSNLFRMQSYNAYVAWETFDKKSVPEDAVSVRDD